MSTQEEIFIRITTQAIIKFNSNKPDNCQFIIDLFGNSIKLPYTEVSPSYLSTFTLPGKTFIRTFKNRKVPSFETPSTIKTPEKGTVITLNEATRTYYNITQYNPLDSNDNNFFLNTDDKSVADEMVSLIKPIAPNANVEIKSEQCIPIYFFENNFVSDFTTLIPIFGKRLSGNDLPILRPRLWGSGEFQYFMLEVLFPFKGDTNFYFFSDGTSELVPVYYVSWFMMELQPSMKDLQKYLQKLDNNDLNAILKIGFDYKFNSEYSNQWAKIIRNCCTGKLSGLAPTLGFFCEIASLQPSIDNNQCEYYMNDICKPKEKNDMSQDNACACYSTYEKHNDTDKQIAQVYKQNNRNVSPKCIYTDCAGGDSYKTASVKNAEACQSVCISGIFTTGNKFGDINISNTTISAACGKDGLYLCSKKCEEGEICQQNVGNDKTGTCVTDPNYNKPVEPVEPVTPNPVDPNPVDPNPVNPVKKSKTLLIVIILSIVLLFILFILFY